MLQHQDKRNRWSRLTIIALISIIIVAISIVLLQSVLNIYPRSSSTSTISYSTTIQPQNSSITVRPNSSVTTSIVNPASGSAVISKTWDSWNYTVSINATTVNAGDQILVRGNLTYIGQTNINVSFVKPTLILIVYNATGKRIWFYSTTQVTSPAVPVSKGERFSDYVYIPTTNLKPGFYSISAEPPFYSYPDFRYSGGNLQTTANFTVR